MSMQQSIGCSAHSPFSNDALLVRQTLPPPSLDQQHDERSSGGWPGGITSLEANASVKISTSQAVERRSVTWQGMAAELVESAGSGTIECRFRAPVQLLVVFERGTRLDGETSIEGLPCSSLKNYAGKLALVPAGADYHDRQHLGANCRMLFFYFDPLALKIPLDDRSESLRLTPRLFFEDAVIWNTALKLGTLIQGSGQDYDQYLEAVAVMLAHEIARVDTDERRAPPLLKGGLAAWQQRNVTSFIEDHLSENVPLSTLSRLVNLSPCYFCRAFKQSFGVPPRRYRTGRRIERAKVLLADTGLSVTDIGFTLGFSQTSTFTSVFHKLAGLTPTAYRRARLD